MFRAALAPASARGHLGRREPEPGPRRAAAAAAAARHHATPGLLEEKTLAPFPSLPVVRHNLSRPGPPSLWSSF
ncbi:hypothetical protein NHX12_030367 [Muraenolepis orangiensis]|uniref:Uncharacterized protein n=1 Tax=Muraenolepis orangiensis TaxID=630683 RepID=A0A9Q0EA08_9TELE|nr:hypothetical protein NHX12_030367 [Muraenolepis orangiensis]